MDGRGKGGRKSREECKILIFIIHKHSNTFKNKNSKFYLTSSLKAQWIECPPSVQEVMGSIPVGDPDFIFVPCSSHVNQFTFHIFITKLKISHLYSLITFTTIQSFWIAATNHLQFGCQELLHVFTSSVRPEITLVKLWAGRGRCCDGWKARQFACWGCKASLLISDGHLQRI